MYKYTLIIATLWTSVLYAQPRNSVYQYIDTYKTIAISEMERSGVPASITLSQGILESSFGNSSLAIEANNHFGIKCHNDWQGETYYKWDDDEQPSCFRVYDNADNSFADHSDFLTKYNRYSFLFDYAPTAYKKWAKGLQKAGYATSKTYADKLIDVIERYELQQFDRMNSDMLADNIDEAIDDSTSVAITDDKEEAYDPVLEGEEKVEKPLFPKKNTEGVLKNNGVKMIASKMDDSPLNIAMAYGVPFKKLLKYNDLSEDDELIDEQYVYLRNKRCRFRGKRKTHKVKHGETMYSISQLYGIKLKALYRKNKMEYTASQEPAIGQELSLKGRAKNAPRLRPRDYTPPVIEDEGEDAPPQEVIDQQVVITSAPKTGQPTKPGTTTAPPTEKPTYVYPVPDNGDNSLDGTIADSGVKSPTVTPTPAPKPTTPKENVHIVKKGETLYRISKLYSITVERLKEYNNLLDNTIEIGQELRVK